MITSLRVLTATSLVLAISAVCPAYAQNYPSREIRMITAGPAGGGNDQVSRRISQGISGPLGVPIIVDNRAAALVGDMVAKAPADGYTLLIASEFVLITPLLEKTTYDPVKDLAPVTWVSQEAAVLVVHPSVPVKSVPELIAYAKAHPGEINYATSVTGGLQHLAGELFKSMAGVNLVAVSYKSLPLAITDLLAGRVQVIFVTSSNMGPIRPSKLLSLGVTTDKPSGLFPGLQTISASGVPGYQAVGVTAIWAPAKTPPAAINRVNQEIVRFLKQADTREMFFKTGSEVVASTPEELGAFRTTEMTKWGKVIKDAGIKATD